MSECIAIDAANNQVVFEVNDRPLTPETAYDVHRPAPGTLLQIGERYYLAGDGIEAVFFETDRAHFARLPAWQKQMYALAGLGGPEWLQRARMRWKHAQKP